MCRTGTGASDCDGAPLVIASLSEANLHFLGVGGVRMLGEKKSAVKVARPRTFCRLSQCTCKYSIELNVGSEPSVLNKVSPLLGVELVKD